MLARETDQLSSEIFSQDSDFLFHYPVQIQVEKWSYIMFHSIVRNHIPNIRHFVHEYSEEFHLNERNL